MSTPSALKRAIFDSGRKQREIAAAAGLREDHFSRIVNGRVNPTDTERAAIASALGRPVADVFPVAECHGQALLAQRIPCDEGEG